MTNEKTIPERMVDLLDQDCKRLARTRRMILAGHLMKEEEVDRIITEAGRKYYKFYSNKDAGFLVAETEIEKMQTLLNIAEELSEEDDQ